MSKKQTMGPASRPVMAKGDPRDQPKPGDRVQSPLGHGRETIESVVVAFTLALLFRAFEAEAFVIPTGSMAPTLLGRHKDLVCESCGRPYQLSASSEEDGHKVPESRCPNCGRVMTLIRRQGGNGVEYDPRYPSFNGDRILVSKLAYDFARPRRWDVMVFKYPEDAKTNYIKRLVGLPGETVFIRDGDIWIARDGEPASIARKPPEKILAMLQCVYDSRYESSEIRRAGWPACFADWSGSAAGTPAWKTPDDGRSFEVDCVGDATATLRYRHLLPTPDDWARIEKGERAEQTATPSLIDDFQPYNPGPGPRRPIWVGDIGIDVELESFSASGSVVLDLVEAGVVHRCTIDLATGEATLAIPGVAGNAVPRARTPVRGTGSWRLLVANVDDEVSLFVNGRPVAFDRSTSYAHREKAAEPVLAGGTPGDATPGDLAPVGITAVGSKLRVSQMRVLRDIYYRTAPEMGATSALAATRSRDGYPLAADQFFMLGDNSSASKDSRLWRDNAHHVDRDLLIGKALFVFWPHGIPAKWSVPVRLGGTEVRLPFWPNFARMKFIR